MGTPIQRTRKPCAGAGTATSRKTEGVLQCSRRVCEPHPETPRFGFDVDGSDAVREADNRDAVSEHKEYFGRGRRIRVSLCAECGGFEGGAGNGGEGRAEEVNGAGKGVPESR